MTEFTSHGESAAIARASDGSRPQGANAVDATRRRLLVTGAVAAPVIMTLKARPATASTTKKGMTVFDPILSVVVTQKK